MFSSVASNQAILTGLNLIISKINRGIVGSVCIRSNTSTSISNLVMHCPLPDNGSLIRLVCGKGASISQSGSTIYMLFDEFGNFELISNNSSHKQIVTIPSDGIYYLVKASIAS